ncbi:ligase-associated DNA damage response endonuclease PdeM [Pseudolysobacter antarcticus]|nr:ligase-associated DNA damage response endonuclease PdeM [Pseudolysobacter antarcticus]
MSAHEVMIAGESLLLLAEKAIYWPRQKMLIVADIHFGKAASFRALGVPVPHGTTSQNLAALTLLIAKYHVRHIIFLGDFLHSKAAHSRATTAALHDWRQRHHDLQLTLVRGNHDRHAGDPSSSIIDSVDEPFLLAPFAFCHHPDLISAAYVMAGHVHPVARVTAAGDSLRLPCFVIGATRSILPSFGAFTGGFELAPTFADEIFLCAGDTVQRFPMR